MRNLGRRIGAMTATVILLALPVTAWAQRQSIFDWSRLRNYEPTTAVQQLVTRTTMNEYGKRIFYVYHPSLEPKSSFNNHCTESEQTIVLGCYVSRSGIYIYDITDDRLTGVEEVTAAHEMLHAAYERLKPPEKQRINSLLSQTFLALTDERIKATVEQYRKKDATVVPNELHSILATEYLKLPHELETYYSRYFDDRSKIVALSQQYEQAFSARQSKVAAADSRLKELKLQIDQSEKDLASQTQSLTAQRARMDKLISDGKIAEYNDAVPAYNQDVASHNINVASTKKLIEEYNLVVKERNSLVLEENELINAIDSRPSTLNSQ